jgi:uncharacterized protein (TIGR02145 family)
MKLIKKHIIYIILLLFMLVETSCQKDLLKLISVTPGTFTDTRDGQVYKTTTIGCYTWFAQNLNFKTDSSCYYNNDSMNNKVYGRLYTWKAAQVAVPTGWHLPTYTELQYLYDSLGGDDARCQMREIGNAHWTGNNSCANNYSGLTIIPNGTAESDSSVNKFNGLGSCALFWEAQQCYWSVYDDYWMGFGYGGNNTYVYPPANMFAIRCVKNY